jgi:predicted nucleic-acid-binding protein
MAAALDTNIIVRLTVGDVPHQLQLVEKLLSTAREFYVSDLALIEFVYVLEHAYTFPRYLIATSLESVLNNDHIKANGSLFSQSVRLYVEHPALSFVDCCLIVQAEQQHTPPLWTFDKKLANQSDGRAKLLES